MFSRSPEFQAPHCSMTEYLDQTRKGILEKTNMIAVVLLQYADDMFQD